MRGVPEHFSDLVQEVAEKSFAKHGVMYGEFENPLLGPPLQIENAAQLARHVRHVLLSPLSVAAKLSENRVACYDRYSNTLVVLTPDAKNPAPAIARMPKAQHSRNCWTETAYRKRANARRPFWVAFMRCFRSGAGSCKSAKKNQPRKRSFRQESWTKPAFICVSY